MHQKNESNERQISTHTVLEESKVQLDAQCDGLREKTIKTGTQT